VTPALDFETKRQKKHEDVRGMRNSTAATVPREVRSICVVGLCQAMCV